MKLSLATLNVIALPYLREFVKTVAINNSRLTIDARTITPIVDNSTGVAPTNLTPVLTQDVRVVPSGSNLAQRAAFNTAIGKTNDAIKNLANYLIANGFTPLSISNVLTGGDGAAGVAGTIAAQDKTVTATDGSSDAAMLRTEFNSAIVRARNNLSTVIKGVNQIAVALGAPTIKDATGGKADKTLTLSNKVTATTTVLSANLATSEVASKAAADAALTALANDIAKVADVIDAALEAANNGARLPITLTP